MTGRVAIYAAPGSGSEDPAALLLRRRAESWLGRAVDGSSREAALPAGWTRNAVDAITADARRYGFHGTLKAPFRLADGRDLDELAQAVDRFAAERSPVLVPRLSLASMDGFFALVPDGRPADLHALADAVVTHFDDYRATSTADEIERRDPGTMPLRRRELFERWGYPYVLDEFRFHLTVTDRIPPAQQDDVRNALSSWFADSLERPLAIDALALFTEATPGIPFQLHSVHPLRAKAGRPRTADALDHEGTR